MANPIRGEVELPIKDDKGKPYVLVFDINRMCELEAMFPGQTTTDLVAKVNQGNMTVMRAFVWAGLRDYGLNLVEAGDVAQELTPLVAGPAILDAMAKAFPRPATAEGEGGEATGDPTLDPAKAAGDGTGKTSSNAG